MDKDVPDLHDLRILKELQTDGRLTVTELSERVGLSKTPCTERMRRLERQGYIAGYHADLEPGRLGLATLVFVQVTLERTTTDALIKFNKAVRLIPEIEAAHMVAGGFDYLLKVRTRDMAHFREVVGDRIGALPGVRQTHSYTVMETVREDGTIHPALF